MTVEQHFDRALAEEWLPEDLADLDLYVRRLVDGKNMVSAISAAGRAVAGCATVVGDGAALRRGLDLALDAEAAVFDLATLPPGLVHQFLVDGRPVSRPATGPWNSSSVGPWIDVLYLALARGRAPDVARLAAVGERVFDGAERDGSYNLAHLRAFARALRAHVLGQPAGAHLAEAVGGIGDDNDRGVAEYAHHHTVPEMAMLGCILEGDGAGLAAAHDEAVVLRRAYFTRNVGRRRRDPDGALALGAVALRELAVAAGLPRPAPGPYTPATTDG